MGNAWTLDNALAFHYMFTLRENTDKNFYEIGRYCISTENFTYLLILWITATTTEKDVQAWSICHSWKVFVLFWCFHIAQLQATVNSLYLQKRQIQSTREKDCQRYFKILALQRIVSWYRFLRQHSLDEFYSGPVDRATNPRTPYRGSRWVTKADYWAKVYQNKNDTGWMKWYGQFYCIYLFGVLLISFNILLLYNSRFAKQTWGVYG